MPKGKGTYGKQKGRPSDEDKKKPDFLFFKKSKKGKKRGKK